VQLQRGLQSDDSAADYNEVGIEHRVMFPKANLHKRLFLVPV
jgi:hypothetical protein